MVLNLILTKFPGLCDPGRSWSRKDHTLPHCPQGCSSGYLYQVPLGCQGQVSVSAPAEAAMVEVLQLESFIGESSTRFSFQLNTRVQGHTNTIELCGLGQYLSS